MSRIVSGKIRLSLRPVSVLELCAESIASIRPTAEAKGIEIESRIDPDAAGTFQADAPRLQQVLWNLLSNAVKFTPAGGKVALRVERREETVCFEVQDDGIGIAAEFLPFVFERFRQSDASTTRKHRGLGLGLAIVKNLVELHGGTIHAESAGIGAGSLFVVTIPARAGETAPPADPPAPASAPAFREEVLPVEEHPLRGVRVMAIDDEPESLALLRRILEDAGAEVTTASSAQQAETILEETRPDVLVSDIGMPGEDGYSLIRRIRATQGELARIPALALTAFARVEDRHRSLESGFQKHLSKPFSAAEVIAAVAALARAARLEEGEREGEDPRGR
ncbi:MAG: ATP-binding protein [Candidatus Eisenbacteria bacterium]|nr:ATP-binding protein [Candidatus Eisenbacteria bacterium]